MAAGGVFVRARLATPDGAFPDPHHHALRPTGAPGCLARILPRRREPHALIHSPDPMKPPHTLDDIFESPIQTLAPTLQRDTVTNYRCVARRCLGYLHAAFPPVRRLSQLRRDPHLLGWFRWMCEQNPNRCATKPARTICLAFAGCSTTWPPMARPSSRTSFAARTSRHGPGSCPGPPSPRRPTSPRGTAPDR